VTHVSQAVLLAAGRGSRLGELTANFPKALLDVGGRPILFRILEGLVAAGIRDIVVITGHEADVLAEATGSGERWGARISYRRQETLDGTARALALARELLGERPFFVGWGDIVVESENYLRVVEASEATGAAVAVNEVEDPTAGAAVYFDDSCIVTRLVEKPAPGTSSTRWNNAGLAVFPPTIWPFIEALTPSPRGEYELPQAVAAFAERHPLTAVPLGGPWFDVGTPESLAAARAHFGG